MNPLRSMYFRAGVAIAATLFFVLVLVTGALVYQHQQTLEHKLRENMIWGIYQYDREVRELRIVIAEERLSPTPAPLRDDSELLLRLDILFSRVQLLQSGEMGRMLKAIPELHAQLMASLPRVDALDKDILALIEGGGRNELLSEQLLTRLTSLQGLTGELLLDINAEAAIQRSKERNELLELYTLALILLLLLTLSGAVLVVALIAETRGRASKARMLEERTRELDGMVQLAQAASQAKSEFMAIMSHEIRTPLNGMVGVADLIGEEVTSSRGKEYLDTLRQSAESLQVVINDVLDYSKIEAGNLELDQRCFSLPDFLDSLVAHYARQCDGTTPENTCMFLEERADDLPTWVKGDINRLRQVLTNLLNNAFKFCPKGTIRLGIRSHENDTLYFEVQDSGCGIDHTQLGHLFAPFTQVDTSMARRHEGTGLGLAISKRLVEAMGGEIGVESHLGLGSRFWCTVTLPELSASDACPEQMIVDEPLPQARILVVEDNEVNQSLARAMLEFLGQQVTVVGNGEQALEWLSREGSAVDLIFMDMQMPVLDGLATTRLWRQIEAGQAERAHLPIISMTANVMQEDAQRCLVAGMDAVLHKPFTRNDLSRVLRQHLVVSSASDISSHEPLDAIALPDTALTESYMLAARKSTAPEITHRVAGQHEKSLADNIHGDMGSAIEDELSEEELQSLLQLDTCQELLETLNAEAFSKLLGNYLTRLDRRVEQMSSLHVQSDYTMLKREAHSLKGASASLGCQRLASAAEVLESALVSGDDEMIHQQLHQLEALGGMTRRALVQMRLLQV
ncbi:ATP-binding protein [Cobetia crustatorum]|uniref:histidine kinase n=1 Tax=Cobetia crustatorum TaxID=553385 RepID=A0A558HG59_9GAMM|nr:ATP-binding protein [Cobetia crustatorum]TVU68115.1 response regulator [Cobetia crustatorum]